ncbi:MAG: LLM class flavin-dependent oxidoreductase [Bacteroidetes bacterium]|nr:LLM class flavin-dependent oxidoreductase [Bacteroidota bacterium]
MELGISMFGDNHYDKDGKPQPAGKRLREMIEEIKLMDETGLDFFGIGEHHRPDYAVSVPEIILAAASTVTKNIKLGSAVNVISSSDPVRLYESYAMIDQISNGRAEIVAGRGSFIESFPLYGYRLEDYDDLFEEKLDLLVKINQENPISWKGKFRPPLNNQLILPRAVNDQLKIWVAVGGTPESVVRAARYRLPVIFAIIGGNTIQFKPLFEYYKEMFQHFGHSMDTFEVGVHIHSFFGDDSKKVAEEYYPVYSSQMDRVGRSRGWSPYQRQQFDAGRTLKGHLIVGDTNEAVEKILYLKEILGITRFSAHIDVGGPSHDALMKTIEIFGNKVAPKVREALKKQE